MPKGFAGAGRPPGRTWQKAFEQLDRIEGKVDRLQREVGRLTRGAREMAVDFTAMEAEIARQTDVVTSVEVLLDKMAVQIAALSTNSTDAATQAAIDGYVSHIAAHTDRLTAAVAKNTPGAPVVNPLGQ